MLNFTAIVMALVIVILVGLVINMWSRLKKAKYNLGIERAQANLFTHKYNDIKKAINDTYAENKHKGVLVAGMKKIVAATKGI